MFASRTVALCSFVFTFAVFAESARALPTGNPLPGPSGLGTIPTSQVVPQGQVETSLNYERADFDASDGHASIPTANLTFGLRRGEIGATYVRERSSSDGFSASNSYFALHGKAQVYARDKVKVAIGAHYYDFGSDSGFDLGNVLSAYATGSYDLRRRNGALRGRGHAGLLVQRIKNGDGTTTRGRPFVGAEYFATPELSVALDYLARSGDVARAETLSLRYQPASSRFSAQVGVGKLRSDTKYFVGATYRFGR